MHGDRKTKIKYSAHADKLNTNVIVTLERGNEASFQAIDQLLVGALETDSAKPSGEGLIEGGHKSSNTASCPGSVMERVNSTHHAVLLQNNTHTHQPSHWSGRTVLRYGRTASYTTQLKFFHIIICVNTLRQRRFQSTSYENFTNFI